jgi:hypothetical protein
MLDYDPLFGVKNLTPGPLSVYREGKPVGELIYFD